MKAEADYIKALLNAEYVDNIEDIHFAEPEGWGVSIYTPPSERDMNWVPLKPRDITDEAAMSEFERSIASSPSTSTPMSHGPTQPVERRLQRRQTERESGSRTSSADVAAFGDRQQPSWAMQPMEADPALTQHRPSFRSGPRMYRPHYEKSQQEWDEEEDEAAAPEPAPGQIVDGVYYDEGGFGISIYQPFDPKAPQATTRTHTSARPGDAGNHDELDVSNAMLVNRIRWWCKKAAEFEAYCAEKDRDAAAAAGTAVPAAPVADDRIPAVCDPDLNKDLMRLVETLARILASGVRLPHSLLARAVYYAEQVQQLSEVPFITLSKFKHIRMLLSACVYYAQFNYMYGCPMSLDMFAGR